MMTNKPWILFGFLLGAVGTQSGCAAGEDGGLNRLGGASTTNPTDNPAAPGTGGLNPGSGGLIPGGGAAGGAASSGLGPNVCASAMVSASRVTPTVYFVLDGSSSMNAAFGGTGSRWRVLRDALVGQNGVVRRLDSVVKFGMTIYSNNDPMKCPAMTEVPAKLSNLATMEPAYPAMETGGGTPTGEALQHVIDALPNYTTMIDGATRPPIVILATDGEPNGCSSPATCDWVDWANCLGMLLGQLSAAPATYDTTLAAVRSAKTKGIPVWVISLADGLNSIPDLQKTANIGAGLADNASPGATIYSPKNPDDLTTTLSKLLGDAVTCDVLLAGTLAVPRACEGSVTMNGTKLACNDAQGWKATDTKHIQLQGDACNRFKSDPSVLLDARFPCDVVVPD
jgi:hypothetical protein